MAKLKDGEIRLVVPQKPEDGHVITYWCFDGGREGLMRQRIDRELFKS